MAKEFPESVTLKKGNCPSCKSHLEEPRLDPAEAVVRVLCGKSCGFFLDLYWLGDAATQN